MKSEIMVIEIFRRLAIFIFSIFSIVIGIVLYRNCSDILLKFMSFAFFAYGVISVIYVLLWYIVFKKQENEITLIIFKIGYYTPMLIMIASFVVVGIMNKVLGLIPFIVISIAGFICVLLKLIQDIKHIIKKEDNQNG